MEEVAHATTTNRSVIGSMNQLGMFLNYELGLHRGSAGAPPIAHSYVGVEREGCQYAPVSRYRDA
jgi:hypothetical protein